MKSVVLALGLSVLFSSSVFATTFERDGLRSWALTFDEISSPYAKTRCDEGDEAIIRDFAEQEAKYDCRREFSVCEVVDSYVTHNGRLTERLMEKYGIEEDGYLLHYGCEARAMVRGHR